MSPAEGLSGLWTSGDASIVPSPRPVRNLGVVQDANMSMHAHVSRTCSSAYMHLRNISRICPFLSWRTTEQLVHAFVSSRLDMGNALLFGISQTQLSRLQRIQNSAARLVTQTRRCDHITPVLRELHWLPVKWRIEFKILLQVYRAVNTSISPCLHLRTSTTAHPLSITESEIRQQ